VREGFAVHALSFRYGQRHAHEVEAARRIARRYGVARHVVVDIDLATLGGSALTDAHIAVPKDRPVAALAEEHVPVTYVPARNTVFLSYALALAETTGARDVFLGVNALDYSGYPDCRPEYVAAFERMANLATRAGVEAAARGETALRVRTPLLHLSKAEIVRLGLSLGVEYAETTSCYDPDPRPGRPAATATPASSACAASPRRGARTRRPYAAGPRMSYTVRELFHTLQGEGRAGGPRGGVLPLQRVQPVDGARAGPPPRRLPLLRHRLRGRGARRRAVRHGGRAGRTVAARWTAGTGHAPARTGAGRAPARGVHRGASRCSSSTRRRWRRCTRAASRWPSRPTARSRRAGLDWICVSPKAGAPLALAAGDELKLVYPQAEPEAQPERFEGSPSATLAAADGRGRPGTAARQRRRRHRLLPAAPALAAVGADAQGRRRPLSPVGCAERALVAAP
jgi:7-cyano-7-deazaguanine synthase